MEKQYDLEVYRNNETEPYLTSGAISNTNRIILSKEKNFFPISVPKKKGLKGLVEKVAEIIENEKPGEFTIKLNIREYSY